MKNKIWQAANLLCGLILLFFITGCDERITFQNEESRGVTLYLPKASNMQAFEETRDSRSITFADETTINNLRVLIFDKAGGLERNELLTESGKNSNSEWNAYVINDLKEGNYYFYVFANIDSYLDVSGFKTISEVEDAVLNFADNINTENGLQHNYLPMACLSTQIIKGNHGEVSETGLIDVTSESEIYAVLNFLCSKVRYTLLVDSSEGGFSEDFAGSNVEFKAPYIKNIATITPVSSEKTINDLKHFNPETTFHLAKTEYPEENSRYLGADGAQRDADLKPIESFSENENRKAWQGIVYLPENLSEDNHTKLIFPCEGIGTASSYEFDLYEDIKNHGLKRHIQYDVICKLVNLENGLTCSIEVDNWSTYNLDYSLTGKKSELIVESTSIELTSGTTTSLGFQTNIDPDNINFNIPKYLYKGENIDFYLIDVRKDEEGNYYKNSKGNYQLDVKINPEIPYSELEKIENNPYNSFEIIAGNLYKAIEVKLNFKPYILAHPSELNIYAIDYIYNNLSTGTIKIDIESNIASVLTITPSSETLTDNENPLFIEGLSETITLNKGWTTINLRMEGINKDSDYWKQSHKYNMTLKADESDPYIITINVNPPSNGEFDDDTTLSSGDEDIPGQETGYQLIIYLGGKIMGTYKFLTTETINIWKTSDKVFLSKSDDVIIKDSQNKYYGCNNSKENMLEINKEYPLYLMKDNNLIYYNMGSSYEGTVTLIMEEDTPYIYVGDYIPGK
ncbi:MAG: hypothetical protein J1E82_02605 [Muribaculaceae bacterium]|nr:hypothetical protein [Muribaculaceae bacterium]